ncbi:MAG: Zn-ribbon domain-containing OB-fold protein [Candidatus Aenigmarchaeota archaeon]|nr:Zn-ribbon domain-containing OB-fold protein [Candidatus Aenigmarchaeota archaeon]
MPWRAKKGRYNFMGTECAECRKIFYPGRPYCQDCHKKTADKKLSGRGVILTYTENHTAPVGFEKYVPYMIAIVELEEGPMVAGQVVGDTSKISIGKKVHTVFRKLFEDGDSGLIHYGMKFELDE